MVLAYRLTYIDQWNKTDRPEVNPCIYGETSFDKGTKTDGEGRSFQQTVLGKLDTHVQKSDPPNAIYKDELKMDQEPKCNTFYNSKALRRKKSTKASGHWICNDFLVLT